MYTFNKLRDNNRLPQDNDLRADSKASLKRLSGMKYIALTFLLLMTMGGCIKNDIPYPYVHANFTSFEVEGQLRSALIDSTSRVVTVFLNEDVNIEAVKVSSYTVSKDAVLSPPDIFDTPINLSDTLDVVLSIYQDYNWSIAARQDIERYFTIENQVGSSVIDPVNHTVVADVASKQPLNAITVKSIKLAGPSATMDPDLLAGPVDFTDPVTVKVTQFGRTTYWTITIVPTELKVDIQSVDAWTCVAWLHGVSEEGRVQGFQYRQEGEESWITVPTTDIVSVGGAFSARICHLKPDTRYEARAVSGDEISPAIRFTTGSVVQMPNSNFEDWWLNGKEWDPWSENGSPYWGTGNKGAITLGNSNSVPIEDPESPTGYRGAQLESKFVGISILGKLAAGNIFAGTYVKTVGTNGVIDMGREFTQRPTRLTGRLKYKCVDISHASTEYSDLKGRPDTCSVWIALIDSDQPFQVRTDPKDRSIFDPNAEDVIAYGIFVSGESIDDYIDFKIELDYRSTSRVPKFILTTASASKYGDYFTGGNGSTLWIQDFKLEYDY